MYNWILVTITGIGFLICLIVMFVSSRKYKSVKIDCPLDIKNRANVWIRSYIFWTYIDWLLIVLSFGSSMIVLYIESVNIETKSSIIIYSVIAASTTIISFAISPRKHISSYRKAWVCLDSAICRYLYGDNQSDLLSLVHALETGEKYIDESVE